MGDKSAKPWKPTKKDLSAAHNKRVPDIVAPGLKVLFVGINPGLYSAAVGRHFARPGNRFWPALYEAGFTDRRLSPFEEQELLSRHIGITNIVERASAAADHLTAEELLQGARRLGKKIDHYCGGGRVGCVALSTLTTLSYNRGKTIHIFGETNEDSCFDRTDRRQRLPRAWR